MADASALLYIEALVPDPVNNDKRATSNRPRLKYLWPAQEGTKT